MKVIVFGATGAIGTSLIEYLSKEHSDWEILAVTRSLQPPISRLAQKKLANVKMVQGDPLQKESVLELSKDCDMIYSCVGFPRYERKYWAEHWPKLVDYLLEATGSSKKLIFCDNLYAYGATTNISPSTPTVEASNQSKPNIRAGLRQQFQAHMEQYPNTVTVVGAADFFGPHITNMSFLGDAIPGKIVQGQSPQALYTVEAKHDFCYGPDFGQALAIASVNPKAYDKFWICQHSIKDKTLQEIGNDIAQIAGQPSPVKFTVLSGWMIVLLSPFMGFLREVMEMKDFWRNDYTVNDSDFCQTFGVQATPYDEALKSVVDFFQTQHEESKK